MRKFVSKQLVFDFLAGKATVLQRQLIDEWYRDPLNEELFYQWLSEWEQSHLQYVADKESGLDRYHEFIVESRSASMSSHGRINIPLTSRSRRDRLVWMVAASIAILIGSWSFRHQLLNRTYSTQYGQTRLVALSDGSKVTLNANSTLRVPRFGFGDKSREVWLEGEALFSVTHTASHQRFVVKTDNNADVVVLGTEFTLFARPRGTQVVLQRGKVEFHYQQAGHGIQQVTLKPGEKVDLTKNGTASVKPTPQPANYSAWRDHRYVFEKTSLSEIAYLFQENFGMKIQIPDPETAALTLSGAYPSQSADELLSIIAEALNIHITRQEDKVLLSIQPL